MQSATPRGNKFEGKKDGSKSEFKKPAKVKPPMRFGVEAVKKEASKKADSPVKRTQSVQNVAQATQMSLSVVKASAKSAASIAASKAVMKRAQSSQNVSGQKNARVSAPSNAMAYNAELLANFEKEKKLLERRISELIKTSEDRQRDNEKFRYEVKNLKSKLKEARILLKDQQKQHSQQSKSQTTSPSHEVMDDVANLRRENSSLRGKLKELNSCLDDHEGSDKNSSKKHKGTDSEDSKNKSTSDMGCKCDDCADHNASSCPEKRSTISLDGWDRQSNKSSEGEVSLHCLQDRILQMEENHYSTNEELQATHQELNDLQKAVNDLTDENEKLANERHVLLESLCSQTEKLENARLHVDFVKSLLLGDSDIGGSRSETERQLLLLVKSAQEEREELLLRQVEMSNCLQVYEREAFESLDLIEVLQNNLSASQKEVEDVVQLKQHVDSLNSTKDDELQQSLLDLEKLKILQQQQQRKIVELEGERRLMEEKNELTLLIDLLRSEKEDLSTRLVTLEQDLSEKKFEICRLQENLQDHKEQLASASSRVEGKLSGKVVELEGQAGRLRCRVDELAEEVAISHKHIDGLRLECEVHIDEKQTHTLMLARAESELRICKSKTSRAEMELKETREKFVKEQEDWFQFQKDLQRAVVIANEFKTEALEDMEKVSVDFSRKQEQLMILNKELNISKTEIDHLKQQLASSTQQCQQHQQQLQQQQQQFTASFQQRSSSDRISREELRDKVLGDRVSRRHSRLHDIRQQHPQLSVRTLVTSIEQQSHHKITPSNQTQFNPILPQFNPTLQPFNPTLPPFNPTLQPTTTTTPGNSSVCGASGVGAVSPNNGGGCSSGSGGGNGGSGGGGGVNISPLATRLSSASFLRRTTSEEQPSPSKLKSLPLNLLPTSLATEDQAVVDNTNSSNSANNTQNNTHNNTHNSTSPQGSKKQLVGILNKSIRRENADATGDKNATTAICTPTTHLSKTDPLANLAKQLGGSKRNALLKWCQNKIANYVDIEITNFSSSWNDGMAFCALLHTYLPHLIPYQTLNPANKVNNFALAFKAAESVGILPSLDIGEMASRERPDWQTTMAYVTCVYMHFEGH